MKTRTLPGLLAVVVATGLSLSAATALAQSAPDTTPTVQTAPQLSYGVSEVVKLAQAKASDDTIIAYVKNSGNSYGLDADQIIYLQQQGVSGAVITTMLNQPRPAPAAAAPAAPAYTVPQPTSPAPQVDASGAQPAPSVTYVQPSTTYYYDSSYPYYYPGYDYGYYGYPVTIGLGWGWGGWRGGGWGGGWHGGGWGGGWHGGGGGWHGGGGGFHIGGGGGGFHGGGGGHR